MMSDCMFRRKLNREYSGSAAGRRWCGLGRLGRPPDLLGLLWGGPPGRGIKAPALSGAGAQPGPGPSEREVAAVPHRLLRGRPPSGHDRGCAHGFARDRWVMHHGSDAATPAPRADDWHGFCHAVFDCWARGKNVSGGRKGAKLTGASGARAADVPFASFPLAHCKAGVQKPVPIARRRRGVRRTHPGTGVPGSASYGAGVIHRLWLRVGLRG